MYAQPTFSANVTRGKVFSGGCLGGYTFGFNGKEKVDEVYGDANAYDFGARIYDPRIVRWLSVDPLAEKYPSISPYAYVANNPIMFIDPDGKAIYKFDENGNYLGVEKDNWWHNLWNGHKGVIKDSKDETISTFRFSDPKNDTKDLKSGLIKKIVIVDASDVRDLVSKSGGFRLNNRMAPIKYMRENPAEIDFSTNKIQEQFKDRDPKGLISVAPWIPDQPSQVLFLVKGGKLRFWGNSDMAYNHMNFGNFLYGALNNALGLDENMAAIGAHVNSLQLGGTGQNNGYDPQPDSKDDQDAIRNGWRYGADKGYVSEKSESIEVSKEK